MAVVGGGPTSEPPTVEVPVGEGLLTDPLDVGLPFMTVLGGSGFPLHVGQSVGLRLWGSWLYVMAGDLEGDPVFTVELNELRALEITGPGTVTSGGGFMGGGFGLEGAAAGMAIAGVLNAVTSKKQTATYLRIEIEAGELFLHCPAFEPLTLRILLSPVYVGLK